MTARNIAPTQFSGLLRESSARRRFEIAPTKRRATRTAGVSPARSAAETIAGWLGAPALDGRMADPDLDRDLLREVGAAPKS